MSNQLEAQQHTHAHLPILETHVLTDPNLVSEYDQYSMVLKKVLPLLGDNVEKIVYAQVMLALKISGALGEDLTPENDAMITMIKEAILSSDEQRHSALLVAQRILNMS